MMWLALLGAISFEVAGTISMRFSEGLQRRAWIVPVVVCYVTAYLCLSATLSLGLPVGIAYGIWSAVGVATTALLGRLCFGDPLTRTMVAGIALIVGGVLLIELGR